MKRRDLRVRNDVTLSCCGGTMHELRDRAKVIRRNHCSTAGRVPITCPFCGRRTTVPARAAIPR